jgi:hypothetical protein
MARKRKPEPVEDEDDDDLEDDEPRRPARRALGDQAEAEDDDPSKPKDDAYTGLMVLALVALIGACVFWYLDHEALSGQQVSPPSVNIGGLGATAPTAEG